MVLPAALVGSVEVIVGGRRWAYQVILPEAYAEVAERVARALAERTP
ncbi:hypothetical protein HJ590_13680 [Naumannella sp. ID2617S]|nr:hypothetical protein [Enemella dayhoffiae]NNG20590.1 hypothetical protein [Naumannella sp. ID2617S]